ncbi:hypothetical protein PM082_019738 [Marasmius tenuissimus]|nr:hypothetical protein PM082_019738 [Marasmius tenuissimus]
MTKGIQLAASSEQIKCLSLSQQSTITPLSLTTTFVSPESSSTFIGKSSTRVFLYLLKTESQHSQTLAEKWIMDDLQKDHDAAFQPHAMYFGQASIKFPSVTAAIDQLLKIGNPLSDAVDTYAASQRVEIACQIFAALFMHRGEDMLTTQTRAHWKTIISPWVTFLLRQALLFPNLIRVGVPPWSVAWWPLLLCLNAQLPTST